MNERVSIQHKAGLKFYLWLVPGALLLAVTGCGVAADTAADAAVPVRLVVAELKVQAPGFRLPGQVVARRASELSFRVPGRIQQRMVVLGQRVPAGATLAVLDEAPLRLAQAQARSSLLAAQATLRLAQQELQRIRPLVLAEALAVAQLDAAQAAFEQAQAQQGMAQSQFAQAQLRLRDTRLQAPVAGVVSRLAFEVGQVVEAGQAVLWLADTAEQEVAVAVPERYINGVTLGDEARISLSGTALNSMDAPEVMGVVREVAASAEEASRSYRVRLSLPAGLASAKLGMSATVRFQVSDQVAHVQLPLTALFAQNGQSSVWILPRGSQQLLARRVEVASLQTDSFWVPERGGVVAGERVVVSGVHRLDEHMLVKAWDGRLP
ncbi:MAG: efflux RND transporter periplasmic adaptor subunit [Neisseriaceae bacterium]|nr:efflux RND transporter periplasmic adaptor subunit [Neisseriaceae bacterium]